MIRKEKKTKPGRSKGDAFSAWNESIPERAYKLCLLGLKQKELAVAFGVSIKTIELWVKTKPAFSRAIEAGRKEADAEVAHSMYKRAVGMTIQDHHIAVHRGQVIVTPVTKEIVPDVNAQMFWLKNRHPEKWADIWKMDATIKIDPEDEMYELSDISDDELKLMEKLGLQSMMQSIPSNLADDDE